MAFTKGSLILIDYTAKVKDSNEVVETTMVDDAKNITCSKKTSSINQNWFL